MIYVWFIARLRLEPNIYEWMRSIDIYEYVRMTTE
jgi:hypothetical protein